jgi:hypothetical protein
LHCTGEEVAVRLLIVQALRAAVQQVTQIGQECFPRFTQVCSAVRWKDQQGYQISDRRPPAVSSRRSAKSLTLKVPSSVYS